MDRGVNDVLGEGVENRPLDVDIENSAVFIQRTTVPPMMLVAEVALDGAQPGTDQVFSTLDRLLLPSHIGGIARDVVPLSAHRLIEVVAEFSTPISTVPAPSGHGDKPLSFAGLG